MKADFSLEKWVTNTERVTYDMELQLKIFVNSWFSIYLDIEINIAVNILSSIVQ